MQWIRAHPYLSSLLGVVVVILLGALFISKRSAVEPEYSSLRAWGGVGANLLNPTSSNRPSQELLREQSLYTEVRSGPPFYYAPQEDVPRAQTSDFEDFNFDEFLTMLSTGGKFASGGGSSGSALDAYSFIPKGLLSTSTPQKGRTELQYTLYNYANDVASYIQSYEDLYRNAPQILKDQFEDRKNPDKNAALLGIAGGMRGVGNSLLSIEEVPSQAKAAHERLAKSYQEMAAKLSKIPEASSDAALVDAMLAYNVSVESFTKNYVAFATLLSAYNVTFKPDDPGSIFTFTNTSSF